MLSKTSSLLATLVVLTSQVSTNSLVKPKIAGDKLYVFSNRTACVTVESQIACPVSWKLPPEYALTYKNQVSALPLQDQDRDLSAANTKCKGTVRETVCTQITPRCLPDGGKDFGDALAQCKKIYTSMCPSGVASSYERRQYCEQNPTGKHVRAACVSPNGHIRGACPQPKYKMPADLLKNYEGNSRTKVHTFRTLENLRNQTNGNRVLSRECLKRIKDFECLTLYCSKDEERLLVEHDYEDCEETWKCYRKAFDAMKPHPRSEEKAFDSMYESLGEICLALPRRDTADIEAALPSAADGNEQYSKILFLSVAVYAGFSVGVHDNWST